MFVHTRFPWGRSATGGQVDLREWLDWLAQRLADGGPATVEGPVGEVAGFARALRLDPVATAVLADRAAPPAARCRAFTTVAGGLVAAGERARRRLAAA